MKTAAFFSVAMAIIVISGCFQCNSVKYTKIMSMANDRWLLWRVRKVDSVIECALHCHRDRRCVTFQHSKIRAVCKGHAVTLTDLDAGDTEHRHSFSLYYSSKATQFIGAKCALPSECRVANSTCHDGVCKCQLGFNFSPAESACVQGCKEYGKEFTMYKNHAIYKDDDWSLSNATVADCKRGCVAQKNFLCITIDYNSISNHCKYSTASWNDFPSETTTDHKGWNFLQRDCKP